MKLEIKELEIIVDETYRDWGKLPETHFAEELFFSIWDGNLRVLTLRKSAISELETTCATASLGSAANKNSTTVIDDEGQEIELAASSTVTKQVNKYLIMLDSNIASGSFSLIATKKGNKSINSRVYTDDDGSYTLRNSRNLKGFVLELRYNRELLDKNQVN